MFYEDADDSQERAGQGRKNMKFRELYQAVKLEVRNEANFGNNKTTCLISQNDREFVDELIDCLTEEGYKVRFIDGRHLSLEISWEQESE